MEICTETLAKATPMCPPKREIYLDISYPQKSCEKHANLRKL